MNEIKLHGVTWDHPRGYDPLVAASRLYQQKYGVQVDWVKRSLKDFGDQSLTDLAETYDLLIIDHPHSGVAKQTNSLVPLEDIADQDAINSLKSQSAGPSFTSYTYDGHQWALPIDAAFQSASYRPDLLQAPIPNTWDEVFHLAERLRARGQFVGMALCPTDVLCSFLSLSAQFGAPIDEANKELLPAEKGQLILETLEKMRDLFHPMSLEWNPIMLYDHMAEHDDVVYCPLAFNYTNYSRDGFRSNKLIFADAPHQMAVLGGAGIAVSSKCEDQAVAVKFATWVCGEDIQRSIYTQEQGQPANQVAWHDDSCNDLTYNFFSNTEQTLANAYVRPRYSGWPTFQAWLGGEVYKYLKGDQGRDECLNRLDEEFKKSKGS